MYITVSHHLTSSAAKDAAGNEGNDACTFEDRRANNSTMRATVSKKESKNNAHSRLPWGSGVHSGFTARVTERFACMDACLMNGHEMITQRMLAKKKPPVHLSYTGT